MKKADVILITILLLVSGALILFQNINKKQGNEVVITVDEKVYKKLSLTKDQEFKVKSEGNHYNIIKIKNGKVSVSEADCKNQVCVKTAPIGNLGESIACLPHRVIVKIVSSN